MASASETPSAIVADSQASDIAQNMAEDALDSAGLDTSDVAAVVEGTIVTRTELEEAVKAERVRLGIDGEVSFSTYLAQHDMTAGAFELTVLETLIDNILVETAADKLGIVVTSDEVSSSVNAVEALYPSRAKFLEAIQDSGFTASSYSAAIRQHLLRQRLAETVIPAIDPTDEQIAIYAKTTMSGIVMKRSSFILVPRTDYQTALQVQERLDVGEDFAELAREYSVDMSAEDGGDAGWDFLGLFSDEYLDALAQLEVGKVSPIVATKLGFYIIECTGSYEVHLDADGSVDVSAVPSDIMESIKQTLRDLLETQLFGLYLDNLEAAATVAVFDTEGNLVDPADTGLATQLVYNLMTVDDALDGLLADAEV